ncbi:hypothetical protein N9Z54_03480 [Planctomycetota bacterium]|jgi:hypothetical protein|nr:hypothetical protein [Planctomycetota bacterium]
MIRAALSLLSCAAVLALGAATAGVQVENYEDAAELDRLTRESEWNLRRSSGLRVELERFEFDLAAEHTRRYGELTALSLR